MMHLFFDYEYTAHIEGIDPAVRAACEAILTKRGRPTSPPRPIITSRPIPTTPTPSMTSPTPTNGTLVLIFVCLSVFNLY